MVKYAALGVVLGVVGGLALSIIINNHFDEIKRYNSVLYDRGETTNTEVPCP